MPSPPVKLLAVACLLLAPAARAEVVLTTDGRILDGAVRFDDAAESTPSPNPSITIVQRTGPTVRVELAKVLLLSSGRTAPLECGVVLTSGSIIATRSIDRIDGRTLRVTRSSAPPESVDIALNTVADMVFRRPASATLSLPVSATTGVLLSTGDFFEGEVLSLQGNRIVVSSALFGERVFQVGTEVLAARLRQRPAGSDSRRWRIALSDGSVARSDMVRVEKGRLAFTDPVSGPASVTREQLVGLTAPSDALVAIDLVSPATRLPSGLAAVLRKAPPWPDFPAAAPTPLAVTGSADVTVDLGGRFSAVFLRAGAPVGHLPGRTVRISVLLDGARLFRSAPLTAIDDPLFIAIPTTGKQTLILRAEVEGGGAAEVVFDSAFAVKS